MWLLPFYNLYVWSFSRSSLLKEVPLTFLVLLVWCWWLFYLFSSGEIFLSLILKDSFAGQRNLGCRSLLFTTLNVLVQSLVACKVSVEKPADSLMGAPLLVSNCLSLAALKALSLNLWESLGKPPAGAKTGCLYGKATENSLCGSEGWVGWGLKESPQGRLKEQC